MKVLITLLGNENQSAMVDVEKDTSCLDLKTNIENTYSIPIDQQKIVFGGRSIENDSNIINLGIEEGSVLELNAGLIGGGSAVEIPDHLRELANKHKSNKMICRKCYARLPINAFNCRKRKCGHCPNIRPKKKLKEKEGKK